MATTKQAKKSKTETTTIPAPEPTQQAATKATKTTKATKAKKTEEVAPTPPPVAPAPAPATTTTTTTTETHNVVVVSNDPSITDGFTEFMTKFQALISQFSSLKTELKLLERRTVKELKVVQKLNNKKARQKKKSPSGFVKPSPISDELAVFLGVEKGSEMARTDVTREINKYIRANDLQDKQNGRKINPDKKLCELLKLTGNTDVELTYFNLQRYMGPHFPKQTKTEATTAA
jgi:chromatin remodeling complex protein RSC6